MTTVASDYRSIPYDVADGVATITLNWPEQLNAISRTTVREMANPLERCRSDGAEPPAGLPDVHMRLKTSYSRIVMDIMNLRKPMFAHLQGYATGAGFEIALACDIRIKDAREGPRAFCEKRDPVFTGRWLATR